MKLFQYSLCFLLSFLLVSAEDGVKASSCNKDACVIDQNCRCSNADSPLGSDISEYPQLLGLTIDDALRRSDYSKYWDDLLSCVSNPDGNNVGATFFVPHEFTDYTVVADLYNTGYEIGVNSISKYSDQDYWRYASVDTILKEFQGQQTILNKFARIPKEQIVGVRTPQLQLAGNNSIKGFQQAGFVYDNTWPSIPSERFFPYTLDYLSTQQCLLGNDCPNEVFNGFWMIPLNDLVNVEGKACNTIQGCNFQGTAQEIADILTKQITEVYKSTKVPMTLSLSTSWFKGVPNAFAGFKQFMQNMVDLKDVFFVNQKQVIDFIKNPVKTSDFKTAAGDGADNNVYCDDYYKCTGKKESEERTFVVCVPCPTNYPWLDNPEGN